MLGRIISSRGKMCKGGPPFLADGQPNHFWQNYLGSESTWRRGKHDSTGAEHSYTVIGPRNAREVFALPAEHAGRFRFNSWVPRPGGRVPSAICTLLQHLLAIEGPASRPRGQAQADMARDSTAGSRSNIRPIEKERKSQLVPLHEWLVGDVAGGTAW